MWKKVLFWFAAVVITLSIAFYQRLTGPTHPKSFEFSNNGKTINFHLPRSQNGTTDAMIDLKMEDVSISGYIYYKRYKTSDLMDTIYFHRENENLVAWLPKQPPAGKLEYGVILTSTDQEILFQTNENLIIRFKDNVPAYVLIPHILLIFTAMLFSTLSGFYAMEGYPSYRFYTLLTLLLFLTGGMIMGPVVQKFAFGEFWTGFPHGQDLTDNKALFAFVMWIIAWIGNRKKERRYLVILAAIANIAIALIPHSARGSELDYNSGEIKTGLILLESLFM